MKRILASVLALLLTASLAGCGSGYKQIDVPKELKIDVKNLSENTDVLMSIDEQAPLLTAIPEKGLYIYSTDATISEGVLIKYDGLLQFFPWRFTPQISRADVYLADYNADGLDDIAFTFRSEVGETAYCENLHVLTRGENGFKDYYYTADKAVVECGTHILVDVKEKDMFTVYVDGKPTDFTLKGHDAFEGLYLKRVQDFTLGEEISVELDPGMLFVGEENPVFSTFRYTAKIVFDENDNLTQTDAQVSFD